MNTDAVYRTEAGLVFRVHSEPEGHLSVEQLRDGVWQPAKVGMAGLRVAKTTKQLTERQIAALGS